MSQTTHTPNQAQNKATQTHTRTDRPEENQGEETRTDPQFDGAGRSDNLRDSPTMSRLLDALEKKTNVGHYGQFTFVAVARHFMEEDEIVNLLAEQPDMDAEKARALYLHIVERDYNPPRRERLIEQQGHQEFQIIPDPENPDSGNLYRELRFPDGLYEHINDYYEDKAAAHEHAPR